MKRALAISWILLLTGIVMVMSTAPRAQVKWELFMAKGPAAGCGAFPSMPGIFTRFNSNNTTNTGDGTAITAITDLSGNGNNAVTILAGTVWKANPGTYNSNPTINMANTGGFDSVGPSSSISAISIYMIGNISDTSITANGRFASFVKSGDANDFNTTGSFTWSRNGSTDGTNLVKNSITGTNQSFTAAQRLRIAVAMNSTNSQQFEGTQGSSSFTGNGTDSTVNAASLTTAALISYGVGWTNNGFTTAGNIDVVEFLVGTADWTSNFSTLDTWETCTYGS